MRIRFSIRRLALVLALVPLLAGIFRLYSDARYHWTIVGVAWSNDGKSVAATAYRVGQFTRSASISDYLLGIGSLECRVDEQLCAVLDVQSGSIPLVYRENQDKQGITCSTLNSSSNVIAFDSGGTAIAASLYSGGVLILDTKTGRSNGILLDSESQISVAALPDERLIAVGSSGKCVLVNTASMDIDTITIKGVESAIGDAGMGALPIAVSPSGTQLLLPLVTGDLLLHDLPSEEAGVISLQNAALSISGLDFTKTGREIVVAHKRASGAGVSILEVDGASIKFFPVEEGAITSLARDPVENRIIAVGPQLGLLIGDIRTCEWHRKELAEARLTCVAFAPDGKRFATGDVNGVVTIWNAHDFKPLYRVTVDQSYSWAVLTIVVFCSALWAWAWAWMHRSKSVLAGSLT